MQDVQIENKNLIIKRGRGRPKKIQQSADSVSAEIETKKLSKAEYWEWRHAIVNQWFKEQKAKVAELELQLMRKDAEILAARMQSFNATQVKSVKDEAQQAAIDYANLKGELEVTHKVSLTNCVIDDFTFEIKKLDAKKTV